ncbi:hypothetical protein S170810_242 [Synechococcus phage S-CAM1]|uniref:Uncharacterized protein n=1 Tax=Synechococcus phage S-CAM1 TaxID=754037 RepID=A0A1D8KFQ8_9CAUD|nr:hypothetical protein N330309_242 [Synechococcus phage S-CAM1]AOV57744.1 hypothetical protein N170310_242 [Synechococcus phage S-CAM1]AOV57994.1 hypothetical protein C030809_242 [Synechococcus phage S-CAM1]AOV58244.1 hypothetical protein S170810_242 [Synechococcus phage S-CAM1]AOV58494.1 hypothetical protein C290910_242 [Synechococcus phage S-CAM1]
MGRKRLKERGLNHPNFRGHTHEHLNSHQEADPEGSGTSRRTNHSHLLPWCWVRSALCRKQGSSWHILLSRSHLR